MTALAPPQVSSLQPVPFTPAQQRIVTTAHGLFAEHGIRDTTLQMIADTIGVTKAAVYHQFKAKEDIVLAVAASELAVLELAVSEAEAEPDLDRARELLLNQVIDLSVSRRRRAALLQHDPVMVRVLAEHEPFRALTSRLYSVLTGEDDVHTRVQAAIFTSAMGAAVVHPLVAQLDDDQLREELLHFARRLLAGSADPAPRTRPQRARNRATRRA
jgi:AcrR family transcriptional regulator